MKISKSLKLALKAIFLQCSTIATDKGELTYDGELAEGLEVFVAKDNDGDIEYVPAEDGRYEAETIIIEVADGKVSKIEEKTVEEVAEEKKEEEKEVSVLESADEPIVEVPYIEGVPESALEPEPIPEKGIDERIAELELKIETMAQAVTELGNLRSKVEELEAKIAELEITPATEPIKEEPVAVEEKMSKLSYLRKK